MSALSGITVSADLASKFADAVQENTTRFIVVTIRNESLVHELSVPIEAAFQDDLAQLQRDNVLRDDSPAYILAKLDNPSPDWISFYYVPDSAKVRDKMLYASTRLSLSKALGSSLFTDYIFATSKADLTAEAYAAHLRHVAAPHPLSSREQEIADLRLAENAAASYEGSQARKTHIGIGTGFSWSPDAEDAIAELGKGTTDTLVVLTVDNKTETLLLQSKPECSASELGQQLSPTEPCYALFAWSHSLGYGTSREIVFIYSCPSSSPVKNRMLYASGAQTTHLRVKDLLSTSAPSLASRRIETSEPHELNEQYLKLELGQGEKELDKSAVVNPPRFAKPKGPPRRR